MRRHNAHCAMYAASRRANGVPYEELADIVSLWVETAMQLTQADLRKMMRNFSKHNIGVKRLPRQRPAAPDGLSVKGYAASLRRATSSRTSA